MQLERLLQSQGFGSRSGCRALVRRGCVEVSGRVCDDPGAEFEPEGLAFCVNGEAWRYRKFAYIALNKPPNFECSHQPSHYPSVFSLLPPPLIARGIQAVGRLDADTTGLLLLSDDGQFIHRFTSPKKAIGKCYEVRTRHPVTDEQQQQLANGVVLRDDPRPVRALACEVLDPTRIRMTVDEGKYHLVKRMVAASGNRVEALTRLAIGGYALPSTLAAGAWRWLDEKDLAELGADGAYLGPDAD